MDNKEELVKLFVSVGLSEQKAAETVKNDILTKNLKEVIEEVGLCENIFYFSSTLNKHQI